MTTQTKQIKLDLGQTCPEPAYPGRLAKLEAYRVRNEQCARIVAQNISSYGGWDSLMGLWAAAVLTGVERRTREWRLVA